MTPTGPIHHAQDAWQRLTERVDEQDWPAGSLYVIATPIGNLADLTLRAWQALARMDVIAAEDTRQSRSLMDAWGIRTPLPFSQKARPRFFFGSLDSQGVHTT